MLDWLAGELKVSNTVAALLLVLIVAQLGTQAYALTDLARRDAVRGGKKWMWVLAIVFGNLVGAVAYLIAGRPEVHDPGTSGGVSSAGGEAARRAVDVLYGSREQS